ncbi:Hypothetical predicted protein [Pelobates cultripes]|uniref:Uncharacterized protein n=1 Tax=Pelobates cultripes TaxID=61616 RepID=A0AAD1S458_PELCU|nr:Hypothetical predicted protein [Pelobates cultripes]
MAATSNDLTHGKQQQPASPKPNLNTRDSLGVIFEKIWAKLLAYTRPAAAKPLPDPPTAQTSSTKGTGKPLMGAKMIQSSVIRIKRLPGQRGLTRRYRPHKRRAIGRTRRRTPDICKAQRTPSPGETLDLEGPQACGLKVPALALVCGRGGTTSTRGCTADR